MTGNKNREDNGIQMTNKRNECGYKGLNIYIIAHDLALQVHKMTLSLPHIEHYEEGSQIRRSSKSISSNIVEGFALRRYKNDYIRFLSYAYASCLETREHLDYLYKTGSLKCQTIHDHLCKGYNDLSGMIFSFIRSVEQKHKNGKYQVSDAADCEVIYCHQSTVTGNQ